MAPAALQSLFSARALYIHVYWLASDAITDAFVRTYGSFYVLKTLKKKLKSCQL